MFPSLYYHQLPQWQKLCAGRKIEELEMPNQTSNLKKLRN